MQPDHALAVGEIPGLLVMHRRRCDRRANHEAGRDITMPAHRHPQRFPHPAGRPSRPATTPDLGYQPWRGAVRRRAGTRPQSRILRCCGLGPSPRGEGCAVQAEDVRAGRSQSLAGRPVVMAAQQQLGRVRPPPGGRHDDNDRRPSWAAASPGSHPERTPVDEPSLRAELRGIRPAVESARAVLDDADIRELPFGSAYIMTGRPLAAPVPAGKPLAGGVLAAHRQVGDQAHDDSGRGEADWPWPTPRPATLRGKPR